MSDQVTLRATIAGLVIGSMVLCTNFQFGLQTGWASMMSLPSALLGYTVFKFSPISRQFSAVENVFVQSVAVAVGTGPLAYGLIGIIPAMEKFLKPEESDLGRLLNFTWYQLMIWSTALAFFGVFIAIPLRRQVILREKLPFPSGTATAILISVLHGTDIKNETEFESRTNNQRGQMYSELSRDENDSPRDRDTESEDDISTRNDDRSDIPDQLEYRESSPLLPSFDTNFRNLSITFIISSLYTIISYFIPILRNIPIFGRSAAKALWTFQPSPAYIGQGIIMGLPTVSYMMFGSVLGWGILSPLSRKMGWAPGEVDDWQNGSQGWIMWISLAIMISDSIVSFIVMTIKSLASLFRQESDFSDDCSSDSEFVKKEKSFLHTMTIYGLIGSTILCCICLKIIFGSLVPLYTIFTAIILALLLSVLAVRALGETDLNPVSGIGKLSQLIFAIVVPSNSPNKIIINLVAGAIAEAGAQQAGDLMQDLKTGHLINASPKAQFIAQLIGTTYSIFLSSIMYRVYNKVYTIPSSVYRIPTAVIWIDCARLVTGQGLPPKSAIFAIIFAAIFATISLVKNIIPKTNKYHKYLIYLPSGIAVGVGIYNTPNFTLARFLGGIIAYFYEGDDRVSLIIMSSGLVLGEGLFSVVTMIMASCGI